MRSDLRYRLIDDPGATSPHVDLIKRLIRDIYAKKPAWLVVADSELSHQIGADDETGWLRREIALQIMGASKPSLYNARNRS